jgi:hypothetical protein
MRWSMRPVPRLTVCLADAFVTALGTHLPSLESLRDGVRYDALDLGRDPNERTLAYIVVHDPSGTMVIDEVRDKLIEIMNRLAPVAHMAAYDNKYDGQAQAAHALLRAPVRDIPGISTSHSVQLGVLVCSIPGFTGEWLELVQKELESWLSAQRLNASMRYGRVSLPRAVSTLLEAYRRAWKFGVKPPVRIEQGAVARVWERLCAFHAEYVYFATWLYAASKAAKQHEVPNWERLREIQGFEILPPQVGGLDFLDVIRLVQKPLYQQADHVALLFRKVYEPQLESALASLEQLARRKDLHDAALEQAIFAELLIAVITHYDRAYAGSVTVFRADREVDPDWVKTILREEPGVAAVVKYEGSESD